MKKGGIPSSVDAYIKAFPGPAKKKLGEIRALVKSLAPEAEERISYQMPAFFQNGNLVYFAGYAKHIGFYPGANGVAEFAGKLSKYKHAKGSVQFPIADPLPLDLIKKMVKFKLAENLKKEKRK